MQSSLAAEVRAAYSIAEPRTIPAMQPGKMHGLEMIRHGQGFKAEGESAADAWEVYMRAINAKDNISFGIIQSVLACHGASYMGGWYHDPATGTLKEANVGEKLMLIVSEVAEAMEADRKGLMDDKLPHRPGIEVELADAYIRICDLAGAMGLDLAGAVVEKMAYNAKREDHKPEVRAAGGKAY